MAKKSFTLHQSSSTTQRQDSYRQLLLDLLADGVKRGFNDIFMAVLPAAKLLYPAKGEETMRLQGYELLIKLVNKGQVERENREYWVVAKPVAEEGRDAE